MSDKKLPDEIIKDTVDEQMDRIRRALSDRQLAKVAKHCGLHENTVRAIAKGKIQYPELSTIEKLSAYLFTE